VIFGGERFRNTHASQGINISNSVRKVSPVKGGEASTWGGGRLRKQDEATIFFLMQGGGKESPPMKKITLTERWEKSAVGKKTLEGEEEKEGKRKRDSSTM